VAATHTFTTGQGLDNAMSAFGGDANTAVQQLLACFKSSPDGHRMGRLMVPGGAHFDFPIEVTNLDIFRVERTGFGYHDEAWEMGVDYPPTVMRWTTQTNLTLCMRLIAEGKFKVDSITTHTIPLEDVDSRITQVIQEPGTMLGVVFEMNG